MIVYLASQDSAVPAEIAGRAVWYFLNSVTRRFLIIITLASNGLSTLTLSLSRALTGFYTSLLGPNIFLSITALLGKCSHHDCSSQVISIYPPTKLLFRSLAVSNLGTGLLNVILVAIVCRIGISVVDPFSHVVLTLQQNQPTFPPY